MQKQATSAKTLRRMMCSLLVVYVSTSSLIDSLVDQRRALQ